MCSDLVAGTHGRGFWILDDVTPRQAMTAQNPTRRFCSNPSPATPLQHQRSDPMAARSSGGRGICTPARWSIITCPPLPVARSSEGFERSRQSDPPSSTDPLRTTAINSRSGSVQPALSGEPDRRGLRVAPVLARAPAGSRRPAGMHHFSWDMHYDPLPGVAAGGRRRRPGDAVPPAHTRREFAPGPRPAPTSYLG